ncbi:hypothetical protein GWI34_06130 [Actinomadura sp. DSM 109109]|nr:hypothetical protein [Actinomadura lepetitiana]
MSANNSGQKPDKPAENRSYAASEQRIQRSLAAEIDQAAAEGKKPDDLPETPSPSAW